MPKNIPLVSIITPSFNQGLFIEETIRSVIHQEYSNLEYLIIDGGSTDNSIEIITKYENQISYWLSEPDNGQAHAINKGLRRANGEILGWINSDDILLPRAINRIVDYFNKHPDIDVVYSDANRIDEVGRIISKARLNDKRPVFSKKTIIGECTVTQPGSFWRRWVTDKVGLLDENLNYVMDYELWTRMALGGATFARLSEKPLANFRLSKNSKTVSRFDQSGHEKLMLLNKLLSDPELSQKTGMPIILLRLQARRARALACFKIFQAHSQRENELPLALKWLRKSVTHYPFILLIRHRAIFSAFLSIIRKKNIFFGNN
jgi:glycosyltransferase involved in cell wall biosynthesis